MRPHRRLRSPARGFTLIELMVVVVIIAVLATLAVPLFVTRIRQQAVTRAATSIADTYRGARTRALGRGAAILVTSKSDGSVEVLEGVESTAALGTCANLPTRGCSTNNWSNLGSSGSVGTARIVGGIAADTTHTTAVTLGTTEQSPVHVCFSPGGRTFVNTSTTRPSTAAGWSPLTDVLTISVTGSDRTQKVVVLPNGTARLGL